MKQLQEIYNWYLAALESYKATREFIEKYYEELPINSRFSIKPVDESINDLNKATEELMDLVVVSLFSAFEAAIKDDLESFVARFKNEIKDELMQRIIDTGIQNPSRWPFGDILDLYKARVDSDLVGRVKQIYEYRNWVAHGKKQSPDDLPSASTTPKTTLEQLSSFYSEAGLSSL